MAKIIMNFHIWKLNDELVQVEIGLWKAQSVYPITCIVRRDFFKIRLRFLFQACANVHDDYFPGKGILPTDG